jgi:NADPH2:quinone reductase
MAKAIMLRAHGGPEMLRLEDVAVAKPGPGELRIRQTAIGVNFHDCYVRAGSYQTLKLPGVPGIEGVGVVEEIGAGVEGFAAGDRIGYIDAGYGAYASERVVPAAAALKLPDALDDATAAAVLLKGLTASMLVNHVHRVAPGETILVQAAAGGVGQLLCQWARHLGATVIGTVGNAEKAAIAKANGCAHTVLYRSEDFVARVKEITGGKGVAAAYDSVGKDTLMGSLACLGIRGHLVNFGQSSGPVAPFAVSALSARSNSVTRPMLFHYMTTRPELETLARSLLGLLSTGQIMATAPRTMPLAEAGKAHAALEARETTGSLVLIP